MILEILALFVGLVGCMFVCSGLRYTSHWEGIQKVRRGPCSHGASVKLTTESLVKENLVWHRLEALDLEPPSRGLKSVLHGLCLYLLSAG